jgi:hypothetical protein
MWIPNDFHPGWPEAERERAFRIAVRFIFREDVGKYTVRELRNLIKAEIALDRAAEGEQT